MCSPKFEVMQRGVCPIRAPLCPGSQIFSPSLPLPLQVFCFLVTAQNYKVPKLQARSPNPKSHSTPRILKMGPCGDCKCCSGGSCGDSCKCTSCGVRLFSPFPQGPCLIAPAALSEVATDRE